MGMDGDVDDDGSGGSGREEETEDDASENDGGSTTGNSERGQRTSNAKSKARRRAQRRPAKATEINMAVDRLRPDLRPLTTNSESLAASHLGSEPPSLEALRAYSQVWTQQFDLMPIDPGICFGRVDPATLRLLHSICSSGLAFDPFKHVQDGVFEQGRDSDGEDTNNFKLYIRYICFPTKAAFLKRVADYEADFPADVRLPAALRAASAALEDKNPVYVPYVGISCRVSAEQRELADHDAEAASRRANFLYGDRMQVFELRAFSQTLDSPRAWREDPSLSQWVVFIISLHHGRALNSALGGFYLSYQMPADMAARRDDTARCCTIQPTFDDSNIALSRAFDAHADDEDCFWKSSGLHPPQGRGKQFIRDLTLGVSQHDGRVDCVVIGKDTTEEDGRGEAPFYTRQAGPGPNFSRQLWCDLKGLPRGTEASTAEDIAKSFYAFIDLFQRVRDFKFLFFACAFLSRLLYILKPRVAMVESSQVCWVRAHASLNGLKANNMFRCGRSCPQVSCFVGPAALLQQSLICSMNSPIALSCILLLTECPSILLGTIVAVRS